MLRGLLMVMGSVGTDTTGIPPNTTDGSYRPPGDTTAACGPVGK